MQIVYTTQAEEDFSYWIKHNPQVIKRINQLLEDIIRNPFQGIGKPEPLRFKKSGYWSRRINREHRLVYRVVDNVIYIAQCRYHY